MLITILIVFGVTLCGAILGAEFLPHHSWRGLMMGAVGAVAIFATLTAALSGMAWAMDGDEASPNIAHVLEDGVSGAGLVESFAGR